MGQIKNIKLHIVTDIKDIKIINMVMLFAALCLLITLASAAPESSCKYGKYDCPGYELIKKTKDFEIRKYRSYKYLMVGGEEETKMIWADNKNSMKLFFYVNGHNKAHKKIPMTVPVTCPIMKFESGEYIQDFKMMFWLPEEYQCDGCAPEPMKATDPKDQITLVKWDERIAYVRSYGWYATESAVRHNEKMLKQSLDAAGIKPELDYDPMLVYSASYNAPFEVIGRRNEVMFMQKQDAKKINFTV